MRSVDEARIAATAGLPVEDRRLECAGVTTAVLMGGEGPPVVLLHGPVANALHWRRVIPTLAETHRVVAPDLPGQGATAATASGTAADVVAWLDALVEQTCDTRPAMVGVTLGGAVAACFAAEHGDRLDRLVLVDALGLASFAPAPRFGAALNAFLARPDGATYDDLWRVCTFDLDPMRDAMGARWSSLRRYTLELLDEPDAMRGLGALMEAFALRPIPAEQLARITVPTTLVWGRQDLATTLVAAEAASAHYGWPLHVIDDCADEPPLERPEAFLGVLANGDRPDGGDPMTTMDIATVDTLRRTLGGSVLRPGDDGFAESTFLWNAMIDRAPALVVQPTDTADVATAVDFARLHGMPIAVRGGGHNIAGTALADGGVTIDMSRLRSVVVDSDDRLATVQPGCQLGDVDRAAQEHGLATPLGFVSEVGVAGLTLGGGLGYLTRRFGWAVDNLLEVEIVTADGLVRRASRDENADLFWAVRGAGANFGVVTSFTFRLHEVGPTVVGGLVAWPFERADEILAAYRTLTVGAPRELAVWLLLLHAPPAPFVPAEWHGRKICAMAVCYSGDLDRTEEALAPIRGIGDPILDLLHEQPYVEVQSYLDATEPKGICHYWRTEFLAELGDGLLDTMRDLADESDLPEAEIGVLHLGGALNERDEDDGAVGNRDARYAIGAKAMWPPE